MVGIQTHVQPCVLLQQRILSTASLYPSAVGSVVRGIPQAGDHEVVSVLVFSKVEVTAGYSARAAVISYGTLPRQQASFVTQPVQWVSPRAILMAASWSLQMLVLVGSGACSHIRVMEQSWEQRAVGG